MFDAVVTQWQLTHFSFVATALLLLWAMSPLGGQASLRLLVHTNLTSSNLLDLRYLDTGPLGNMYAYTSIVESNDIETNATGLPGTMSALYEAALLQDAATKQGPLDIWGNVKIPRMDKLNASTADADGWMKVPDQTTVTSFYSLLGLPIVNLPREGVSEFTVESVHVIASVPTRQTSESFTSEDSIGLLTRTGIRMSCPDCINRNQNDGAVNSTVGQARRYMLWGPPLPQPNATLMANMTFAGARKLRFRSVNLDGDMTSVIEFFVTQQSVESRIRCVGSNCRAVQVRLSKTDHRPANITSFDYVGTYALDMITARSLALGATVSSPSELFLNDSESSPIKPSFQVPSVGMVNLSIVDPHLFAERASMLLNTGLGIFMAPAGYTGSLPTNLSIFPIPHIPADGVARTVAARNLTVDNGISGDDLASPNFIGLAPFIAANTTAQVTHFQEVYRAQYEWVAMLMLSSITLIITGVAGMVLGGRTQAPDVFDALMGLTYNNSHLGVPSNAGTLSAAARARLLTRTQVRLGDLQPYSETGKIGFGRMSEVAPLTKGRLYE
jgi:hypothetical protein